MTASQGWAWPTLRKFRIVCVVIVDRATPYNPGSGHFKPPRDLNLIGESALPMMKQNGSPD
jgi:hypothetical protein